jgi:hypothetical protein
MQQMTIYWQSFIPQHVSGVFTPIIRRADCVPLYMVSCPGYGCCGSGESGGEMCTVQRMLPVPWYTKVMFGCKMCFAD